MVKFSLDKFIDNGEILGYNIGDTIDLNLLNMVFLESNEININSQSKLIVINHNDIKVMVGIDDFNKIDYFMLKVPKYNSNNDFFYRDFNITRNSLNEILLYFNSVNVEWKFTEILGKVIRIQIGKIEFVYSYEIDEVGLYSIQKTEIC